MDLKLYLFFSFISLCQGSILAQEIQLSFHHLSEEKGLTPSDFYHLSQDNLENTWIGTKDGLLKFNGQDIIKYQHLPADSLSLYENNITSSCFEDKFGNLWFSTYGALNYYRRESDDFIAFVPESGLKNFELFHFEEGKKCWLRIGAGKDGALYFFDLETQQFEQQFSLPGLKNRLLKNEKGEASHLISTILPNKPGLVWIDLSSKIQKEIQFQKTSEGKIRNYASPTKGSLLEGDSAIWIGVYDGLGYYRLGKAEGIVEMKRTAGIDKDIGWVWAIVPFDVNHLLVASDKGLLVFNKRSRQFVQQFRNQTSSPFDLQVKEPNNLYLDPKQHIWVAGKEPEIAFANLHAYKFPAIPTALGNSFISIQEDNLGRIWCSSLDSGTFVFNQEKDLLFRIKHLKNLVQPNQQFDLPPINFFINNQSENWWGTMDNYFFNWNNTAKEFEFDWPYFFGVSSSASNAFNYYLQLQNGKHLMTRGNTIYQLKFEEAKIDTLPWQNLEYLKLENINSIFQDAHQQIYINDNNGRLVILKEAENQIIKLADKKEGALIHAYLEDTERKMIWLATSKGLAAISPISFEIESWSEKIEVLKQEPISQILKDKNDYLWLAGNNGLARFHPETLSFHRFNSADGLTSMSFNKNAAITASKTGEIWLGTKNGINVFKPDAVELIRSQPKVQLTNFLINDGAYEAPIDFNRTKPLELEFSQNTLSFQFVAVDYTEPGANQFRYQLVGLDDKPVSNSNRGFVRYPNLPHGEYNFKVWTNNSDGIWNEEAFNFPFEIAPPFYQTWWFYLSCLLLISGIIYAIFQYRLEQALKVERMRVKISSDLHDDVGTLLSGLAMQTELLELTAPEDTKPRLGRIATMARNAMSRMRDTVWAIDARKDKLEDLLDRLREHAEENLSPKGMTFKLLADNINQQINLSVNVRQHLYLIFKEAITNIAKHSNGDKVLLTLKKQNGQLEMSIHDNGQVEEKSYKTTGLGLSNMKMRAEQIAAVLSLDTTDGFTISLVIREKMLA